MSQIPVELPMKSSQAGPCVQVAQVAKLAFLIIHASSSRSCIKSHTLIVIEDSSDQHQSQIPNHPGQWTRKKAGPCSRGSGADPVPNRISPITNEPIPPFSASAKYWMQTFQATVRVPVNGRSQVVRTEVRAVNALDARWLLWAQYGFHSIQSGPTKAVRP